ncbi:hypothetical protein AVEN_267614-1 [Araneus ventricosus]|uniref:EGF-like domain-containing protein n=1 Tax=Araneus ventricosus TaxID=182803 RepID=A0A4Y2PXZ9_ARAVE|nr:hypothetical protein AVEN_267614-1 [Araneus ventricosus]
MDSLDYSPSFGTFSVLLRSAVREKIAGHTYIRICVEDRDCYNGAICRRRDSQYYCDCLPNFGGDWCEISMLCENLDSTCRAMGATCKVIGFNAICDCPYGKTYNPRSGICENICDPWRCMHGTCEIMERTYKCNCDSGYTGHYCNERTKINPDLHNLWFPVMTFLMIVICLLLIGVICLYCCYRK